MKPSGRPTTPPKQPSKIKDSTKLFKSSLENTARKSDLIEIDVLTKYSKDFSRQVVNQPDMP